jgi:hypothetical protein
LATDFFSGLRDDEEEERRNGETVEQSTGAQSPIVQGQPQAQPGQPTRSGSFTNLNDYLELNKDRRFGEKVGQDISQRVGQAEQTVGETESGFRSQVDKSKVPFDQNLFNEAFSNTSGVVNDPDKLERFAKMRDAKYEGPKNFVDSDLYSPTYKKVDSAQKIARSAADPSGRLAVLDDLYGHGAGRNDYTKGQKTLDNLLVQRDEPSRDFLAQQETRGQQLGERFKGLTDTLQSYARNASEDTAKSRGATRGTLGIDNAGNFNDLKTGQGAIPELYRGLQEKANRVRGTGKGIQTSLKDSVSKGLQPSANLSDEAFNSLRAHGLGLSKGQQNWGINPADFIQVNPDPGFDAVVSKPDAQRLVDLQKLAGKENTLINQSVAGTYDPRNDYNFDAASFEKAVADKARVYNELVNKPVAFGLRNIGFGDDEIDQILNDQGMKDSDKINRIMERIAVPKNEQVKNSFMDQYDRWFGGMSKNDNLPPLGHSYREVVEPTLNQRVSDRYKRLLDIIQNSTGFKSKL